MHKQTTPVNNTKGNKKSKKIVSHSPINADSQDDYNTSYDDDRFIIQSVVGESFDNTNYNSAYLSKYYD